MFNINNNHMDISKLSPQEIEALKAQIDAKERAEKDRIRKEREQYKELSKQVVSEAMKKLQDISSQLSRAKTEVFNDFAALINMKKEIYGTREGQQSHTFSDDEGNAITLGYRVIDNWDDTVNDGISKIAEYMDGLATDDKSAKLVKMINNLLKRDPKGKLKANRVLDLQNLAEELNDPMFTAGVDIIRQSYYPARSAYFVEAATRNTTGQSVGVPLSMSSVDFVSEFPIEEIKI